MLLLTGITLSVLLVFSAFSDRVAQRVNLAFDDIESYISGVEAGSIGQRFVMWEVGLHGFLHSPFVGVGEDNSLHYQQTISREIMLERIGVNQAVVYGHLHNQYIHEAFTRGIFALFGLLIFLSYLFFYFVNKIRCSVQGSQQLVWSIAGLVFIIASAVSMLTEAWIHLSNGVAFFSYYILLYYFLSSAEDKPSVLDGVHRE
jgi:O-antigen ligase